MKNTFYTCMLFVLFLIIGIAQSYAQSCGSATSNTAKTLKLNKKVSGMVKEKNELTFISPVVVNKNKGSIMINETGGQGKTSVTICKVDKKGNTTNVVTKWFNDTEAKVKKTNESQSINLKDIKGYKIVVQFDGKSVGNTFQFDGKSVGNTFQFDMKLK